MILDSEFNWGLPTITNSNAVTASANITDVGASEIVFGAEKNPYLWFRATITADASPTLRINVVASDEADLDPDNSEASNDVLGSTGILDMKQDGSAVLASGDTLEYAIPIKTQVVARRYYGLLVTLGGTNPDLAAGQPAKVVYNPQTHLIGAQAAVPAS